MRDRRSGTGSGIVRVGMLARMRPSMSAKLSCSPPPTAKIFAVIAAVDAAAMHAIFNAHMQEPDAEAAFQHLRHVAGEKRVALLCFEADACGCHRAVLADRLAREDGVEVVNL